MEKEVKKNNIIILFLLVMIFGILFAGLIYINNCRAEKIDISGKVKNDGTVLFHLDNIDNELGNGYINIDGWAFKKGVNITTVECYVALRNTSTNECYKMNTAMKERTDVTIKINDGFKYDKSGFFSSFLKSSLKNGKYEIILLYQNDCKDIFVPTGEMISIK